MTGIKAKDIIAVVIFLLVAVLQFAGYEGNLDAVIAVVVGYYFGHRDSGVDSGI
jgi:hypothetical protein